jgi:transcriptional regulator with XRE-family HTH domain
MSMPEASEWRGGVKLPGLREWRAHRGLNQTELAQMAGVAQSHLARIESVERRCNPEVAQKLAEILDVDLQELKARTLSPKRPPSTPTSTATAPGVITPGTQPSRRDTHQRGRSRVSSPTTPSRTLPWSRIWRR